MSLVNPPLQGNPELDWKEIKPIDYMRLSDPVQKYPDLYRYLQKSPWRIMSGHSCTKAYMDKFKRALELKSENLRCTIQKSRNFVKLILLTPAELSAIRLADCLLVKVPFIKDKIKYTVSAETQNLESTDSDTPLRSYSGYAGSLCNNIGVDEETYTDFEIEETVEMVQEWIRMGFCQKPRPTPVMAPKPAPPRTADQTKKIIKKVRFAKRLQLPQDCRTAMLQQGLPSHNEQSTQTPTWKELIQAELESDHYYQQLFRNTDTEHDSEDTITSS